MRARLGQAGARWGVEATPALGAVRQAQSEIALPPRKAG